MRRLLPTLAILALSACPAASDDENATDDPTATSGTDGSGGSSNGKTSSTTVGDDESAGAQTDSNAATSNPTTTSPAGSDSDDVGPDGSGSDDTGPGNTGSTTDDPASSSDSADDGSSIACTELSDCCDQIGSDLYAGCSTVVQMGNPDLCTSILGTYHQEGYCTGETFCAELGACCGELPPGPGWEDTCTYYADFGNQPQCAMLIGDYQLSGYCQ